MERDHFPDLGMLPTVLFSSFNVEAPTCSTLFLPNKKRKKILHCLRSKKRRRRKEEWNDGVCVLLGWGHRPEIKCGREEEKRREGGDCSNLHSTLFFFFFFKPYMEWIEGFFIFCRSQLAFCIVESCSGFTKYREKIQFLAKNIQTYQKIFRKV